MCATDEPFILEDATDGWQERVIQERVELEYALRKLNQFIRSSAYDDLLDYEQELLLEQRMAMEKYYEILGNRISNFQV